LAEEEELNQPVNFEKYKLEYNNIKVKTFRQAMLRAKIPHCRNRSKINRNIVERDKMDALDRQIHDCSLIIQLIIYKFLFTLFVFVSV
jgi:hypothetical protein